MGLRIHSDCGRQFVAALETAADSNNDGFLSQTEFDNAFEDAAAKVEAVLGCAPKTAVLRIFPNSGKAAFTSSCGATLLQRARRHDENAALAMPHRRG